MSLPPEFDYGPRDLAPFKPPPTALVTDPPHRMLCVNAQWASFLLGAISRLAEFDVWDGDFDTRADAVASINYVLYQLSIQGDCMAPRLRQNPFDDCELEASYDSGVTWETVFDFSKCIPATTPTSTASLQFDMDWRVDIIRGYYAQGGIETLAPDIVYDATDLDADRDTALCFALNRFVDAITETELERRRGEEQGLQNLINAAIQALIVIGGLLSSGTLSTLILLLMGAVVKAGYAIFEPLTNQELSDHAARRQLACCLYTEMAGNTISLVGLQSAADTCAGILTGSALLLCQVVQAIDDYTDTILVLATAMDEAFSLQRLGVLPACDCDLWVHEWLDGEGGGSEWDILPATYGNNCQASYDGTGDKFDSCCAGDDTAEDIAISIDFPQRTLRRVRIVASWQTTRNGTDGVDFHVGSESSFYAVPIGSDGADQQFQWVGSLPADNLTLHINAACFDCGEGAFAQIKSILVEGEGSDPF